MENRLTDEQIEKAAAAAYSADRINALEADRDAALAKVKELEDHLGYDDFTPSETRKVENAGFNWM